MILASSAGRLDVPEVSQTALIGREGVAVTDMYPSGQVEIDGQRHEARVAVGMLDAGQRVVVRAQREFGLLVESVEERA